MKFWKKGLVVAIAALLLLTTTATAFAAPREDTIDFEFRNKTGAAIQLTLKGPTDAVITVRSTGLTSVQLEPGLYSYRYTACGRVNRGTFTAAEGRTPFILRKCANALTHEINISNRTGHAFILTLLGRAQSYGFWVAPGNNSFTVLAGGYQYTTNACGSPSGQFKAGLRPSAAWVFTCDNNQ
jgi:hypothetical protein